MTSLQGLLSSYFSQNLGHTSHGDWIKTARKENMEIMDKYGSSQNVDIIYMANSKNKTEKILEKNF